MKEFVQKHRLNVDLEDSTATTHPQIIYPDTAHTRKAAILTDAVSKFERGGPKSALGQLLFRAARLAEAMNYYDDEEFISNHLMGNPPLEPPRSLYQSDGSLGLKSDRESQVINRVTAPRKKQTDHNCDRLGFCNQCREEVRKISRVIMVGQLWLWILDGSK